MPAASLQPWPLRCPHCERPVAVFMASKGRAKIAASVCPYCAGKITLNHSLVRASVLLPLLAIASIVLWTVVPVYPLAVGSASILYFGTLQLEKPPNL